MSNPVQTPGRLRSCWASTVPYIFKPKTQRQKQVALAFWLLLAAALVGLFVWGFPKVVDNVVIPLTNKMKRTLTKPQTGAILGAAVLGLPFVFVTYDPAVWVASVVLGFWICFAIVEIATTVGMVSMYFLGRKYLRAWTQRQIQKRENLQILLNAAERVGPFRLQLLLRLGPIPYPIMNYASGVPDSMTLLPYTAGSVLGHLPTNLLGVYFGRNLKGISDLLKGRSMPATQLAYNVVGLVVSTVIVVGGFIYARGELRRIKAEQVEREAAAASDVVQLRPSQQHDSAGQQQQQQSQLLPATAHAAQPPAAAPLHPASSMPHHAIAGRPSQGHP